MADVPTPAAGARNLSAEEIAAQSFATAFRGFDPAHVRAFLGLVSERVSALEARNAELHEEVEQLRREATERVANLPPSPASVAVAGEFSGLLQAARERALEIEAAAAEHGEKLLAEAHAAAARIREEAEADLAEASARAERLASERMSGADEMLASIRAEAEAAAVQIREDAEREAANRIVDARQEADRIIEAAKEQGREVVREAQALVTKRKRSAEAQLDQLRDARERLLANLHSARRAVDEVITGVESGRPGEQARPPEAPEPEPAASSQASAAPDTKDTASDERTAPTPPRGPSVVPPAKRTTELIGSRAAPATEPQAEAPAPEERVEERRSSALRILRRGKPEARKAVHAEPAHPLGEPVEGVRIIGRKAAEAEAEAEPKVEPEVVAEVEPEVVAEAEPEPAPEPEPEAEAEPEVIAEPEVEVAVASEPEAQHTPKRVDELFARIRADREAAVAKAEEVLAEASTPPREDAPAEPEVEAEQPAVEATDEDEALLQRRDSAIEASEGQLTRRLKRALQDEQNELLDGLRGMRGGLSVDGLLGEAAAHRDRYASLAKPFLSAVAREVADTADDTATGTLATELASDLIDALRHRLNRILEECASDGVEVATIGERASSIYREWKTQRAQSIAAHYVVAAHAAASYAAMPSGAEGVWVVDDGGSPCPDCDDNALAGPTARGERFPTGQLHPPAHTGCRCVVRVVKTALTT